MKLLLPLLVLAIGPVAFAQEGGHGAAFLPQNRKAPAAERVTHEELLERKEARSGSDMVLERPEQRKSFDIEALSEFLTFRGHSVLVPRGAIIHVPESLRSYRTETIEGELIEWPAFLQRYPAVVAPLEVTLEEASGAKPIEPARLEPFHSRIVIAVFGNNPISVHPATPAAEADQP